MICRCGSDQDVVKNRCGACRKAYAQAYYLAHKEERHALYLARRLRDAPKNKVWQMQARQRTLDRIGPILAEFRKKGCVVCGETAECCLSAHHVDPSKKLFAIAQAHGMQASKEVLLTELAKCVCVCENCHRKIHKGLIPCPPSSSG